MKQIVLFLLYLLFVFFSYSQNTKSPKYIFYFIGDGMGHNLVTLTDEYLKLENKSIVFNDFPEFSMVSTHAKDRLITCSAAAGTALATGSKTSINTLGLDSSHTKELTSIAEHCKKQGRKIGIITTVPIDHATPAAFYAKAKNREDYIKIGMDLSASGFDYFAGGYFSKGETNDAKDTTYNYDAKPIIDACLKKNYVIINSKQQFLNLKPSQRNILAIGKDFINGPHVPYRIDRTKQDINLKDLVTKGIELLDNSKGFFMMIEGGKIDWACHANDISTAIGEVIDFNEAVQTALNFYKRNPEETLIIVTADHETGGLSLGYNQTKYNTSLSSMAHQKISFDSFSHKIQSYIENKTIPEFSAMLDTLGYYFGLGKQLTLTSVDSSRLLMSYKSTFYPQQNETTLSILYGKYVPITMEATKMVGEKAGITWGTFHHTFSRVPVYAMGSQSNKFT
ncbi:MAG: alkaline phosphatase, partial [Bacteroidales bacterium]